MKTRLPVLLGLTVVAACSFAVAVADGQPVPRVTMPLINKAPTIDGLIGEEEWRHAARSVGLVSHQTGALSSRQGVFWVGSDGANLYVAVKTEAPLDEVLAFRRPLTLEEVRLPWELHPEDI
jgi:hypothetical protein